MNRIVFLRDKTNIQPKMNKMDGSIIGFSRGQPVGCLVSCVDRAAGTISYQYSLCHKPTVYCPGDAFDKKLAKTIATGRLAKKPIVIAGEVPLSGHAITQSVMQHIIDTSSSRTLKALAADWLTQAAIPRAIPAAEVQAPPVDAGG